MQTHGPSDIGVRLKQAREVAGISQNALSTAMDPSPGRAWAGFVESGKIQDPTVDTIRRAATVLDVSFEWLLLGQGEMRQSDAARLPIPDPLTSIPTGMTIAVLPSDPSAPEAGR